MSNSVGKKVSNGFVWALMALLVVGLMGFGTTQFNGGVQSVATVGEREVDVNEYARGLEQAIAQASQQFGTQLTFSQAENFGVAQQALARLLTTAALDNETDVVGLSAGDGRVASRIREMAAFNDISGNFDTEIYSMTLERSGLEITDFESSIRDEVARSILQNAIGAGIQGPDVATETFLNYVATGHDFSYVTFEASALPAPVAAPSEADLTAFFEETGSAYTVPETRDITYVWATPELLAPTIDVSEDTLRAAYEERATEFNLPERRIVERLVFSDDAAVEAAAAALASGDATFDSLVEDRGLELADVDLGIVNADDLGDAAETVMAVTETGTTVVGPTTLGPAIFRINGILYAQNTPFEEVRDMLQTEEAIVLAAEIISDLRDVADDLLAEGATLEEVAEETELSLGSIAYSIESTDGIAAYTDFRRTAATTTTADFPEMDGLDDGGVFALRVNSIAEQRPQTLEEAREALIVAWQTEETRKALEVLATQAGEALANGQNLADQGLEVATQTGITRQSSPTGTPTPVITAAFELAPGETKVTSQGETAYLVRLDGTTAPNLDDDTVAAGRVALERDLAQGIATDVFGMYAASVQQAAGLSLNQAALNAVHAQFP